MEELREKDIKNVCNIYKGDFLDGIFEGKGVLTFKSEDKYEGDFHDDKKEGYRIYYFNDGNLFE